MRKLVIKTLCAWLLLALVLVPVVLNLPFWKLLSAGDVSFTLQTPATVDVLITPCDQDGKTGSALPIHRAFLHGNKPAYLDIRPETIVENGVVLSFSQAFKELRLGPVSYENKEGHSVNIDAKALSQVLPGINPGLTLSPWEDNGVVLRFIAPTDRLVIPLVQAGPVGLGRNGKIVVVIGALLLSLVLGFVVVRRNRVVDGVLVVGFAVVLLLPWFLFDTNVMYRENRRLQDLPELSDQGRPVLKAENLQQSGKELRDYFRDRLGMKKELIKLNALFSFKAFGLSRSEDVRVGSNGWLYFDKEFYNDISKKEFQPDEKLKIQNTMRDKAEFVKQLGSKFYVLVSPDKQDVVTGALGPGLKALPGKTRSEKYIDLWKAVEPGVVYISPVEELVAASKTRDVYFKRDTHWTDDGAQIATELLLRAIKKDFPALQIPDYASWVPYTYKKTGDLPMLMDVSMPPEEVRALMPNASSAFEVYSDGSSHLISTIDPKKKRPLRVLVVRDSFVGLVIAGSDKPVVWQPQAGETPLMMPLLAGTFGEVRFLWTDFDDQAKEIAKDMKPDIVIWEIVERFVPLHMGLEK